MISRPNKDCASLSVDLNIPSSGPWLSPDTHTHTQNNVYSEPQQCDVAAVLRVLTRHLLSAKVNNGHSCVTDYIKV